jgi:hypothetical protein
MWSPLESQSFLNIGIGAQRRNEEPQPATRVQFRLGAVLQHSNTPARNASRSDAGGPSLRAAGFEDSLSDEAQALYCRPLKSASQARRAPPPGHGRSRKDDDEDEAPGEAGGSK